MRYIVKKFLTCLITLSFMSITYAQEHKRSFNFANLEHQLIVALNIGTAAPIPFPNTIRKIERYSPLFNPLIGYEIHYNVSSLWAIGTGIQFERKGMRVVDSVQYFHTMITMDNGGEKVVFEGDFTGMNETEAKGSYLTLPLFVDYKLNKWKLRAGTYLSYLLSGKFEGRVYDGYIRKDNSLGEKVMVENATFDFADKLKTWDVGITIGGARKIGEKWEVRAHGNLGLEPIFPDTFQGVGYKLHQLFFNLGASYNL